jgi:hypothetical protein
MKLSIFALLFLICLTSFGQTNNYQNLLDTALSGHGGLFVHTKPLTVTRLDVKKMRNYVENLRDYSSQKLDTVMFSHIIYNASIVDTTLWTDKELPNFLLVNKRDETVSKKYGLQKLGLTDAKHKKFIKKQVNKFNSTETIGRNLWYFSRPVFDDSRTFAIVQWDNGHSYLGGGGGIILYHLQGNTWKEAGVIINWKY